MDKDRITIGVLGMGNFGTALAHWIAHNFPVLGWSHSEAVAEEINNRHSNEKYLQNFVLHQTLKATPELDQIANKCAVIISCLPSRYTKETLKKLSTAVPMETVLINTTKGMERTDLVPIYDTLSALFPNNYVLQLAGPMVANEFSRGSLTQGIISTPPPHAQAVINHMFENTPLTMRKTVDTAGLVWGSLLKNIYTIGMGVLEVAAFENMNVKGVYIARAFDEMVRYANTQGAYEETIYGLAGLGDFLATSLSPHSHNRRYGIAIAEGADVGDELPEGFFALEALIKTHPNDLVDYPLARSLWELINKSISNEDWCRRIAEEAGRL